MRFVNLELLPMIVILFVVIISIIYIANKKFFKWVKQFWYLDRSLSSYLSHIFLALSFLFFLMSLLDLRGQSKSIDSGISHQNTIIVLDSSLSMLVEDIHPNRFKRSIMLARHFIKNAAGHKVALVVFSDTHKLIAPFTDDFDFLDSRLNGLQDRSIQKGGSNIKKAVAESVAYFREFEPDLNEITGNILLFTDADENGEIDFDFIPKGISLAVVGVGTLKGGTIPLRRKNGTLYGRKKFNNKDVISTLNEKKIVTLGKNMQYFKYWIPLSDTIPSDELMNFFLTTKTDKIKKGQLEVEPVKGFILIIIGIFFYILYVLFGLRKTFMVPLVLFFIMSLNLNGNIVAKEMKNSKLTKKYHFLSSQFKAGGLDVDATLILAEEVLKSKKYQHAHTLYSEIYGRNSESFSTEGMINFGTTMLATHRFYAGVKFLRKILFNQTQYNLLPDVKAKIRENILLAFLEMKKQQSAKKSNKNKTEQGKKSKSGESSAGEKGDSGESNDNSDLKPEKSNDGEKNGDDKESGGEESDSGNKKDDQSGSKLRAGNSKSKKRFNKAKIPSIINQIMNDDRLLQKRYMDVSTQKTSKSKKDW